MTDLELLTDARKLATDNRDIFMQYYSTHKRKELVAVSADDKIAASNKAETNWKKAQECQAFLEKHTEKNRQS